MPVDVVFTWLYIGLRQVATTEASPGDGNFDWATLVTGGAIATILAGLVAGFFGWRRAAQTRREQLEDARRLERSQAVNEFITASLNLQAAATDLMAEAFVGYEGKSVSDMKSASQAVYAAWQEYGVKADLARLHLASEEDIKDLAKSVNGSVRDLLEAAKPDQVSQQQLRSSSAELASRLLDNRQRVVTLQQRRGGER